MRIALVSCVKSKRSTPAPARDLYTSPLFRGLRAYAEEHADGWYILSAKHGLLSPDTVVDPYELTLNTMKSGERKEWARRVNEELSAVLRPRAQVIVLAGLRYREFILPFLRQLGHDVSVPLEGLSMGRQLSFLAAATAASGNGAS